MLFTSFKYQWSWIIEVLCQTVWFICKKEQHLCVGDRKVFRFYLSECSLHIQLIVSFNLGLGHQFNCQNQPPFDYNRSSLVICVLSGKVPFQMNSNSVVCYGCGLRQFKELAYQYRRDIKDDLPGIYVDISKNNVLGLVNKTRLNRKVTLASQYKSVPL